MSSARALLKPALIVAILFATGHLPATMADPVTASALRLDVTGARGTTPGTCFLIHKTSSGSGTTLYFLTAASLFNLDAIGERLIGGVRVRVVTDAHSAIETAGTSVVFAAGTQQGIDLAVVKATVPHSSLIPVPLTLTPVYPGDTFVLRGYRGSQEATLTERVRFRSTRLVVGDRSAADMGGFVGAPALVDGRVFGIVTECSATRAPVITLLSAANGFLARALPQWPPAID